MAKGATSCPACGGLPVRTPGPPGPWQRVATGAIALPLLAMGGILVVPAASDDTMAWPALFGVPALLVGAIFVLATLLPYGVFRRLVVGVGSALGLCGATFVVALIAATAALVPDGLSEDDWSPLFGALEISVAVGLAAFLLGFRVGFRLSR